MRIEAQAHDELAAVRQSHIITWSSEISIKSHSCRTSERLPAGEDPLQYVGGGGDRHAGDKGEEEGAVAQPRVRMRRRHLE